MMKKMKWIILTGTVVLIIALCCVLFILRHGSSDYGGVMDGDGMINPYAVRSFSYYRGGGMENGHYRVTLEDDELTVERRIGQKTELKKYTVPDDIRSGIEKVLFESGMKEWHGDFPESEYIALDADTVSVIIDYYDEAHIEFDSNQDVPDEGWDAVNEAMRLLEAIADK